MNKKIEFKNCYLEHDQYISYKLQIRGYLLNYMTVDCGCWCYRHLQRQNILLSHKISSNSFCCDRHFRTSSTWLPRSLLTQKFYGCKYLYTSIKIFHNHHKRFTKHSKSFQHYFQLETSVNQSQRFDCLYFFHCI